MHGSCQDKPNRREADKTRAYLAFAFRSLALPALSTSLIAARAGVTSKQRQSLPPQRRQSFSIRGRPCADIENHAATQASPLASSAGTCLNRGMLTQLSRCIPALLLSLVSLGAYAQDDSQQIRTAIEAYLRNQTAGLPGQASFTVSPVEGASGRPACPALDVSMAPGARPIGRTTVLVRCRSAANWAIYVSVQIKVMTEYLVTTRPLNQGQLIGENDVTVQTGDLGSLPSGVVLDSAQAMGRVAAIPMPAGRPLLIDQLRQPPVIQAGQTVKVISRGPTFEVSNEGKALSAAAEGKIVQVRLNSGQTVSGFARQGGVVEISF